MQPTPTLINAANALLVVERTRIRRNNGLNALLRRQAKAQSITDISPEDRKQLLLALTGKAMEQGISPTHDPFFDSMEKQATKMLEREVKDSVYAEFLEERKGVAAKSFGRLWAIVGNPLGYTDPHGDYHERTVGTLFQYCGVGDPADKRRAGQKLHHNPKAGPRLHVIAENAGVKVTGAFYRHVYDSSKEDAQDRLHSAPCAPCGTKSNEQKVAQAVADRDSGGLIKLKNDVPAGDGSPWRPGHIHGHALRMVKREFLRDLYNFSLDL